MEFPSVWRNHGFDVVIGNPPYIKTSLVTDYTWVGYKTQKCPNLNYSRLCGKPHDYNCDHRPRGSSG